jgi:hypothetical protein
MIMKKGCPKRQPFLFKQMLILKKIATDYTDK